MKQIISLILLLTLNYSYSQDCEYSFRHSTQKTNRFQLNHALFGADEIFYLKPNIISPINENIPINQFNRSIWVGGKDPSGNVRVCGNSYRSITNNFDFYSGPIYNNTPSAEQCNYWDQNFFVLKEDILKSIETCYHTDGTLKKSIDCAMIPQVYSFGQVQEMMIYFQLTAYHGC